MSYINLSSFTSPFMNITGSHEKANNYIEEKTAFTSKL